VYAHQVGVVIALIAFILFYLAQPTPPVYTAKIIDVQESIISFQIQSNKGTDFNIDCELKQPYINILHVGALLSLGENNFFSADKTCYYIIKNLNKIIVKHNQ